MLSIPWAKRNISCACNKTCRLKYIKSWSLKAYVLFIVKWETKSYYLTYPFGPVAFEYVAHAIW